MSFYAQQNIAQLNTTGTGQWATAKYETEAYDLYGEYDPSTGIYTAKAPGAYLFTASLYMTGATLPSNNNSGAAFVKNGNDYHNFSLSNPAGDGVSGAYIYCGSIIIRLEAGETMQIQGYCTGSALSVSFRPEVRPYFSGQRLD